MAATAPPPALPSVASLQDLKSAVANGRPVRRATLPLPPGRRSNACCSTGRAPAASPAAQRRRLVAAPSHRHTLLVRTRTAGGAALLGLVVRALQAHGRGPVAAGAGAPGGQLPQGGGVWVGGRVGGRGCAFATKEEDETQAGRCRAPYLRGGCPSPPPGRGGVRVGRQGGGLNWGGGVRVGAKLGGPAVGVDGASTRRNVPCSPSCCRTLMILPFCQGRMWHCSTPSRPGLAAAARGPAPLHPVKRIRAQAALGAGPPDAQLSS